jgi:hypothetical protein
LAEEKVEVDVVVVARVVSVALSSCFVSRPPGPLVEAGCSVSRPPGPGGTLAIIIIESQVTIRQDGRVYRLCVRRCIPD